MATIAPRLIEQYSYCTPSSNQFVDNNGLSANVTGLTPVRPAPAASNTSVVRRALLICNNDLQNDLLVALSTGDLATPSLSSHMFRITAGQTLVLNVSHDIVPWIINDTGASTVSPVTWQELA